MRLFKLLFITTLPLLFSCQSNSVDDSEWFTYETIQLEEKNCEIEPCLVVDLKYPIIKEQITNSKSLNEELQRMLGQYLILDGKTVPKDINKSVTEFQKQFEERFHDNYIGASGGLTAHGEAIVMNNPTKIKSILVYMDTYTGGANGMNYYNALNFDSETGSILHFTDIIDNYDAFQLIAEKQFRKQFEIEDDKSFSDAGFFIDGTLTLSEKLSIDDSYVYILYEKYEIAPGAMGPIKLSIPLEDVIKHINVKYRK